MKMSKHRANSAKVVNLSAYKVNVYEFFEDDLRYEVYHTRCNWSYDLGGWTPELSEIVKAVEEHEKECLR
jgi:hypothetical protein